MVNCHFATLNHVDSRENYDEQRKRWNLACQNTFKRKASAPEAMAEEDGDDFCCFHADYHHSGSAENGHGTQSGDGVLSGWFFCRPCNRRWRHSVFREVPELRCTHRNAIATGFAEAVRKMQYIVPRRH